MDDRGSLLALGTFYDQICRALGRTDPPILIVGNKLDLLTGIDELPLRKEAQSMISRWPNAQYLETSAKQNTNIPEAFSRLISMVRKSAFQDSTQTRPKKPRKKRRCTIQ